MPRQQPSSPKKKRKQLDFEDWYEIAKRYYEEHGDLLVPRIYEDEEGHIYSIFIILLDSNNLDTILSLEGDV